MSDPTSPEAVYSLDMQQMVYMAKYENQKRVADYNQAVANAALNPNQEKPQPPMLVKASVVMRGPFADFSLVPDHLYVPPMPAPKPSANDPVGVAIPMTSMYAYRPGVLNPEAKLGDTYTADPRGTFALVVDTATPFGQERYWALTAAAK